MALFSKEPAPPQRSAPQRESPSQTGQVSYFGTNLVLDGTITGNEGLVVEGSVRGKINLESDLRIGASARLEATVHAKNVTVEGVVVGDISADTRLELLASAKVDGNLKAPKIIVAEGARFRGAVDMGSDKPSTPNQDNEESKGMQNAGNHHSETK
ncbi:MAG TPA: polymer-forming cytoskeletal protein [Thermoanaerobaculia bacterium]